MASMNSSVLACNYAVSTAASSDLNSKLPPMPSVAVTPPLQRLPVVIRAQQQQPAVVPDFREANGRRAALFCLAGTLLAASSSAAANAGVIDEYLEKSKANKELNDKKRLTTSGANFARAFTVQFGSCKFPQNFTGCQDLAKQKKVPFLSDDLELECKGKDKYRCGSDVFWKW